MFEKLLFVVPVILILLQNHCVVSAETSHCLAHPARRIFIKTHGLTNVDPLYIPETYIKGDLGSRLTGFMTTYVPAIPIDPWHEEIFVAKVLKRKLPNGSYETQRNAYINQYIEGSKSHPREMDIVSRSIQDITDSIDPDYKMSEILPETSFTVLQDIAVTDTHNSTVFVAISLLDSGDRNWYYHFEYRITVTNFIDYRESIDQLLSKAGFVNRLCETMFLNLCRVSYTKRGQLQTIEHVYSRYK